MAHEYRQGTYHPINRKKYIGIRDPEYRSGWELIVFDKLDKSPGVYRWGSEMIQIPYQFSLDERNHRYYIDLYIEVINAQENKLDKLILEIKPDAKLVPPLPPKNKNNKAWKNYRYKIVEYKKNIDKWKFATRFGLSNNMAFYILTEKAMYYFDEASNNLVRLPNSPFVPV